MPASTAPSISPGDYAGEMYPLGEADLNPHSVKQLWTAVILQLVRDATTDAHKRTWAVKAKDDCRDAIRWLLNPASEDYRMTCSFAGMNGLWLHGHISKKLTAAAEVYREQAGLLNLQAEALTGAKAAKNRKIAEEYMKTVDLIESYLPSVIVPGRPG